MEVYCLGLHEELRMALLRCIVLALVKQQSWHCERYMVLALVGNETGTTEVHCLGPHRAMKLGLCKCTVSALMGQ